MSDLEVIIASGTCVALAWAAFDRRGGAGLARRAGLTPRARAQQRAWCLALVGIALILAALVALWSQSGNPLVIILPLAAAVTVIAVPRHAALLVAVALPILGCCALGLAHYGFLRDYGDTRYSLLRPMAEAFLPVLEGGLGIAAGGWLLGRRYAGQPWLVAAGRLLGCGDGRSRRWSFLLLPVLAGAADLLTPDSWLGSDLAIIAWIAVLTAAAAAVIRLAPAVATDIAVAGLILLGTFGFVLCSAWLSGPAIRGLVDVPPPLRIPLAFLPFIIYGQVLALISLGAWLVPRTIGAHLRVMLAHGPDAELARQVQRLTETRSAVVDTAADDLRRLERDLHDGAQARLVALGMSLREAELLIPTSPLAAAALVASAREAAARALTELRDLVRGVHPPVLADRGLGDAIRALALDVPLRVETEIDLPGRLAAPVESACYFAVAEILANVGKHAVARRAQIRIEHSGGMLRIEVSDDGAGGADPARGTGLAGIRRRLAALDGSLDVSSPVGGPTMIVMEVPCALSSLKISSC